MSYETHYFVQLIMQLSKNIIYKACIIIILVLLNRVCQKIQNNQRRLLMFNNGHSTDYNSFIEFCCFVSYDPRAKEIITY